MILGAAVLLATPAFAGNIALTGAPQAAFDSLSEDLAAITWMNPSNSAEPHSAGLIPVGFQVGVEATSLKIDQNAWSQFGATNSAIVVPRVRISAGIPFGLDFSVMYTSVPQTNIKVTGYEGRMAFGDFIPVPMLELNVRAYQSTLTGIPDLKVKDQGIALMVGADLPVIKPYIEIGQMKATSTIGGASALLGLKDYSKTSTTTTVGAKLTVFPFVRINAEYSQINTRKLYTAKLAFEF